MPLDICTALQMEGADWATLPKMSHIVDPHQRDVRTEESAGLLQSSAPLIVQNRAFFEDMEAEHPERVDDLIDSPSVVPSPLMEEALSDSYLDMRLSSQSCLFPYHPLYMALSTFKCLAVILMLQYHFDGIPGGWMRFCLCGAGNIVTATCTPLLEYITNMVLKPDNAQKTLSSIVEEEDQKDSVFIVEILVRIGHLELTDLTTVLIQGSTFVIFAAVLLPMFSVFCVPGLLTFYSWYLFAILVAYGVAWKAYFSWNIPCLQNLAHPRHALYAAATEFLKAMLMKVFTLFVMQLCICVSLLMGMAIVDGLTPQQGLAFVVNNCLSLDLLHARPYSRFHWFCLCSQLFF